MADVSRVISATAPLAKADRSRMKPAASRTVSRIIPINANNAALLRLMLAVYVYTEDSRAASLVVCVRNCEGYRGALDPSRFQQGKLKHAPPGRLFPWWGML